MDNHLDHLEFVLLLSALVYDIIFLVFTCMIIPIPCALIYSLMAIVFMAFLPLPCIDANDVSLSCSCHCLHTVHGFEERFYSTSENEALQGINFRPNVKGIGQPDNIGIIVGMIILEEDTASKLFFSCIIL